MPMGFMGRSSSSTTSNRATLGARYRAVSPFRGEGSRPYVDTTDNSIKAPTILAVDSISRLLVLVLKRLRIQFRCVCVAKNTRVHCGTVASDSDAPQDNQGERGGFRRHVMKNDCLCPFGVVVR